MDVTVSFAHFLPSATDEDGHVGKLRWVPAKGPVEGKVLWGRGYPFLQPRKKPKHGLEKEVCVN